MEKVLDTPKPGEAFPPPREAVVGELEQLARREAQLRRMEVALTVNNEGLAAYNKSNFGDALTKFREADGRLERDERQSVIVSNMASAAYQTALAGGGRFEEAVKYANEALELSRKDGGPENAYAYNILGLVAVAKGDYDQAAKQFKSAKDNAQFITDPNLTGSEGGQRKEDEKTIAANFKDYKAWLKEDDTGKPRFAGKLRNKFTKMFRPAKAEPAPETQVVEAQKPAGEKQAAPAGKDALAWNERGGWQLHVTAKDGQADTVKAWVGKNHDGPSVLPKEDGRDFIIQVGAWGNAKSAADRMSAELAGSLEEAKPNKTRNTVNQHVAAAFNVAHTEAGKRLKLQKSASAGIPLDMEAWKALEALKAPAEPERAELERQFSNHLLRVRKILAAEFGELFGQEEGASPV